MVKEFIDKWNKYKGDLENYFRNTKQEEYEDYETIVKKVVELIINRDYEYKIYDLKKITVIDDGDYQGTVIYIFHRKTYQPDVTDYIYTSVGYGSCSGCDTLQAIQMYHTEKLPNKEQVKDYMTLCLHLIQNFRKMEDTYE